jgi:hypothetical protein
VLWCNLNGWPRVWADAAKWFLLYDPTRFQRVYNSPANSPPPGALVIWHETPALGIGPDGHIAIALVATSSAMLTLDQNWPPGFPVKINLHSYVGVTGWLVPLSKTH